MKLFWASNLMLALWVAVLFPELRGFNLGFIGVLSAIVLTFSAAIQHTREEKLLKGFGR